MSHQYLKGEANEKWSGEFFWRRRKVVIKRFMLERERGNNYSDKAHSGDVAIGYGEEMQRSMNNYYPLVAK